MSDCCRSITCRGKHLSLQDPTLPMMTRRCLGLKIKFLGDIATTWPLDLNSIMKTHPDLSHSNFSNNHKHSSFRILCFFLRIELRIRKSQNSEFLSQKSDKLQIGWCKLVSILARLCLLCKIIQKGKHQYKRHKFITDVNKTSNYKEK